MRIRRKKWAEDELNSSKFYIDKPEVNKGNWQNMFKNKSKLHIELGCGKGLFISKLATRNLSINYIAVDMIEAMLGISKRNIEVLYTGLYLKENEPEKLEKYNEFQETFLSDFSKYDSSMIKEDIKPENLFLIRANVEQIENVFSKEDMVERIYINFCNPWPKSKHNKRRLTHTRQLEQYKKFLTADGKIYFKTDDDELFEASLEYFAEAGFNIISKTYDLHSEDIFNGNIETEHEKMFTEQEIKIKALIAKL
jgi:tRNA (guanine-N7-)-methyltransferase